jgi:hypothetical protein
MTGKKRTIPATSKVKLPPESQGFPKELKTTFWITLPLGALAVLIVLWPKIFPIAPEQLVEVAWTHRCRCAHNWIKSLQADGYTVLDYEVDDTSAVRQRWRVPDSIRGCHPASYLGYFLEGHISADTLHRLAREHPRAIGVQQVDTTKPGEHGNSKVASSQLLLISSSGAATPWPPENKGGAAR